MDQTARITRYLASLDASTNFWLNHSLDREHGGYFTCLTREGQVYDTRKYVWLMGRAVWMFSRLYREREARPEYLEAAKLNLDFLRRYARREDGAYYFALSREGAPAAFQRKPYGAVFVCIGLAEYARATGEQQYLDEAVELFWKIRQWIADPALLGRARHGQSQLADVMVTISMLQELMPSHDDPRYAELLNQMLDEALAHQHPELGVLTENILADGLRRDESLPGGRLWCPGHSAEVSWFLLRILDEYPDAAKKARVLDNLDRSLELGWDTEQEGLYYFLDTQGLPMLELEWDMKLWWPHTEAMLALAHAWRRTGDTKWLGWLDRMDDYSWRTFVDDPGAPAKAVPGSAAGEWFGYADRSGRITHNAKGNHYKGFFHVPRALWLAQTELRAS